MGSHWVKSKGPVKLASSLTERMENERSRVVNEPAIECEGVSISPSGES